MKTTPIPVKFGREGHPCNFSEGLRAQPRERPRAARAHLRASALRAITGCGAPAVAVAAAPVFPPLAPMIGGGRVAGASITPRVLGSSRVGGAQDGAYLRRSCEGAHRPSRPFFCCPASWAPAATGCAKVERKIWKAPRKRVNTSQPAKNTYDTIRPNWGISAVTLIRTDTTLDHSQKAEKVCLAFSRRCPPAREQSCLRHVGDAYSNLPRNTIRRV